MFILERAARGQARFRLAGTRLCAAYGQEMKGLDFLSYWPAKERHVIEKLVERAFLGRSVGVIGFDGLSRKGRKASFELLLLPLEAEPRPRRALGVISAIEEPYWLGTDPIKRHVLTSLRAVDPDQEKGTPSRPFLPVPSLAPGQRVLGASDNARRIRHLVVIQGGRDS